MLFDEKQVLETCKKYGIETVRKEGYPLYQGKEMDENFSIAEIMHEPVKVKNGIWYEISDYIKRLKRKLKLKGEMCVIGIKIQFLRLKYLMCKVKLKAIDCREWIYLKVCDLKDSILKGY